MSDWKTVNTETLNRPRSETIRGVDVTVYFGQDDMPIGVRGDYDDGRRKFVIEFRYDSTSETKRRLVPYDDHIQLVVGQKSGRLFEMEIDVDAMDVNAVRLLTGVRAALENLPRHAPGIGLNRIDNYVAASGAFQQVQAELESSLQEYSGASR